MAEHYQAMNVSDNPAMKELVDEVFRTRRPKVLRDDDTGAEVEVRPLKPNRSHTTRARRTSPDDPIWKIIAIGTGERVTDVSENHDQYLAEWELSKLR